jgi:hypothetical protein
MKLMGRVVTLIMPVSFTGFGTATLIIMVGVLAAIQGIKYLRGGAKNTH